ncbi:FkbM family methyltransferase [Kineothrix sp. MSJ-39]|uniref:FkbM family methyltransferase n=1 Tax=Kineothrix sp. MSJ-39 TaxID=2841533 RepID=UPI001C1280E8|nr:FkbM family methyltransferase [Kineothrix sp. MSJ-39]MBU5430977.1 FkbM family methyltransferase [Kineothrix sp. MSJ-39]
MMHIDVVFVCVYVAEQVVNQLKGMGYDGEIIPTASALLNIDDVELKLYDEHMMELENVYKYLADDMSKRTMETFLNVLWSGDISLWKKVNSISTCKLIDEEILETNRNHRYIDIGAFDGDTLRGFLHMNHNRFERIVCLEPDEKNYRLLCDNVKKIPDIEKKQVLLLKLAAGKNNENASFRDNMSESSMLEANGNKMVRVVKLDDMKWAEDLTLLKISTMGSELQVLEGAQRIIRANKPMITTYISRELLWQIPLYLKKLVPEYKIYIRHYGIGRQGMACIAKIERKLEK